MWLLLKKLFARYWKFFALLLIPVIFLPVYFITDSDGDSPLKFKCAYVILLMGAFWMTEVLPLAITALIPVVLFPLFNVQSTGEVCQNYMRESVMMFFAGICLALAIEYSKLHKRIALKIMILIGSSPWRLLLGLMVTTMFLSCWIIINTAVTAMMIPIVLGLVQTLDENKSSTANANHGVKDLKKLFMLAIGYSSNIGGTSVIIGSNPNLIAKELLSAENIGQDGKYTDINFTSWIVFNMPIAIINLLICWIYLGIVYIGFPKWIKNMFSFSGRRQPKFIFTSESDNSFMQRVESQPSNSGGGADVNVNITKMLHSKLRELGRITFHELSVSLIFVIVMALWFTRDPQIFQGWSSLFGSGHVKVGDSTIALAFVLLMFIIPKELNFSRLSDESHGERTLLSWKFIQRNLPWNVVLLVGGGFAISDAASKSGLSDWIGEQLSGLESLANPIILLILLIVISVLTEVLSNAACINILLPILIALSRKLNIHPLYLSLPGAIACQYSFMLPVSNPTNAVVFTMGELKILDMIKSGAFLNFACLTVLFLMNITWGQLIFNYSNYTYAEINNLTRS